MLPLVGAMDPNVICHRNSGKSGLVVDLHRLDLGKNMKKNIRWKLFLVPGTRFWKVLVDPKIELEQLKKSEVFTSKTLNHDYDQASRLNCRCTMPPPKNIKYVVSFVYRNSSSDSQLDSISIFRVAATGMPVCLMIPFSTSESKFLNKDSSQQCF